MAGSPATAPRSRLPWWTWPALALDRIRPGVAEQAAADAAWIGRLPRAVATGLPLLAVALPIAFSVPHALAPSALNAVDFTFTMIDVYQESLPFMMLAAALGLLAPSLGLLFVLVFLPADMIAASFQQSEMTPLPMAILARTLSCWVLYLLATELPMAAHDLATWASRRAGAWVGAGAGALTGGALTWVWAVGAPIFIIPVFTWTAKFQPNSNAAYALNVHTPLFVAFGAVAALVALGLRILIPPAAAVSPAAARPRGSFGPILFGIVVPLALFASVVTQPIDAVVLVAAVLGARPLSLLLLRRGPLASTLAAIPRPVRFIAGVAAATAISYLIVSVMGYSTISSFFTMVLAIAVSFLLVHVLLDADDFAARPAELPSVTLGLGATLAIGGLVFLFAAGPVLADNLGSHPDGWGTAAAAAGAAAGAAGLASGSAKNKKKEPNPPPWYIPDGFAEAFGYDSPYDKPPDDPKKPPPDPNKPPPGWPKQRK